MSQSTEPSRVTTLAKGLDATRTFDPDETVGMPVQALMAAMDAQDAVAAEPAVQPVLGPLPDERDRVLSAYMVEGRILREAPLPDSITVVRPVCDEAGPRIDVALFSEAGSDRDDTGADLMARYQELYGGEITRLDVDEPVDHAHFELNLMVDGIRVRVWVLQHESAVAA